MKGSPPYDFVYLGDISTERTIPLMAVPDEGPGVLVRRVLLGATTEVPPNPTDFWVLSLGTVDGTRNFTPESLFPLSKLGLQNGVRQAQVNPKLSLDPGSFLALKLEKRGSPTDLPGLYVALDFVPLRGPLESI